jgi:ferredoxin-NADP reductase
VRSVQAVQARDDVPFTVYVLVGDVGLERTPRSYSIANAPRSDGTVTLLVTRISDGELSLRARTPADLIDNERLERWDAERPQFRYLRTLTRAAEPPPIGRIPAVLAGLLPRLERHRVYIAGDSGFVAACTDAARRHGAAPELVFSEEFFMEPPPWGGHESNRMDANGMHLHQGRTMAPRRLAGLQPAGVIESSGEGRESDRFRHQRQSAGEAT